MIPQDLLRVKMDRLSEWRDAFDYLRERDDLSSSWIDLPSLTLLVRALGFPQVTKESITHMVRKEVGKRQKESKNYDDFLKQYIRLEKTVGIRINFELFCDVMEELVGSFTVLFQNLGFFCSMGKTRTLLRCDI